MAKATTKYLGLWLELRELSLIMVGHTSTNTTSRMDSRGVSSITTLYWKNIGRGVIPDFIKCAKHSSIAL